MHGRGNGGVGEMRWIDAADFCVFDEEGIGDGGALQVGCVGAIAVIAVAVD